MKQTVLNAAHRQAGARMVDFGGWDMPLHYGSQVDEHHLVRTEAGLFDVSHMAVVDLRGADCTVLLRRLLANDVAKLNTPGKALYTCMLNHQGGVIDDLIVYYFDATHYRVVVNASTRDKDLAWMRECVGDSAVEISERTDTAMLALQGPKARQVLIGLLSAENQERIEKLSRFSSAEADGLFIARTGYTGEDGFEIVMASDQAEHWWQQLLQAGAKPAGLGARDTLRLEAGMNLYGQDMDDQSTPLESGLSWTVAFDPAEREFIGRTALEQQRSDGVPRVLVGLVLDQRGVLRHGQRVICANGDGVITSGSFSPTLGTSIAFASLPTNHGSELAVDMRGKALPVRKVKTPFVRGGKAAPG